MRVLLQNKCVQYWPKEGQSQQYDNITVLNICQSSNNDYTLREFLVTKGDNASRTVYHYHFTAWPDHGVPSDPGCVLNFLHDVNKRQDELLGPRGPIIVHCSAGIGRTGTFIVLDMILRQIARQGLDCELDIQRTILLVRSQRSGLVQTEAQYKFVYLAVQDHIDSIQHRMSAEKKSLQAGREYTNIKYSSEAAAGLDVGKCLSRSTVSLPTSPPASSHLLAPAPPAGSSAPPAGPPAPSAGPPAPSAGPPVPPAPKDPKLRPLSGNPLLSSKDRSTEDLSSSMTSSHISCDGVTGSVAKLESTSYPPPSSPTSTPNASTAFDGGTTALDAGGITDTTARDDTCAGVSNSSSTKTTGGGTATSTVAAAAVAAQ
ncbi:PTP type protein phosphatase [Trinorchestia longiramus]|nr:PTP type protein phosphatase [Trinorchestia longiramus]